MTSKLLAWQAWGLCLFVRLERTSSPEDQLQPNHVAPRSFFSGPPPFESYFSAIGRAQASTAGSSVVADRGYFRQREAYEGSNRAGTTPLIF